jgi:hypothetical protein
MHEFQYAALVIDFIMSKNGLLRGPVDAVEYSRAPFTFIIVVLMYWDFAGCVPGDRHIADDEVFSRGGDMSSR